MPSTTSSAGRSCKEEAVGEGRVGADDASSRDARRPRRARSGYAFTLHFPLVGLFLCVYYENLSLSFSLSSVDKKAERRKDATEKVAKLTSTLVSGINRGVLEVFENQKQVEKEAKNLQKKWTPLKSKAPSG